ncbi:hypothetical protein X975_04438, partial [Stegodyphus mimosarum]
MPSKKKSHYQIKPVMVLRGLSNEKDGFVCSNAHKGKNVKVVALAQKVYLTLIIAKLQSIDSFRVIKLRLKTEDVERRDKRGDHKT